MDSREGIKHVKPCSYLGIIDCIQLHATYRFVNSHLDDYLSIGLLYAFEGDGPLWHQKALRSSKEYVAHFEECINNCTLI